jgi:hypothetical protein
MKFFLTFLAGVVVATGIGEAWPGGRPDLFESFPPRQLVPVSLPPRCQFVAPPDRRLTWEPRADGWCYTEDLK